MGQRHCVIGKLGNVELGLPYSTAKCEQSCDVGQGLPLLRWGVTVLGWLAVGTLATAVAMECLMNNERSAHGAECRGG